MRSVLIFTIWFPPPRTICRTEMKTAGRNARRTGAVPAPLYAKTKAARRRHGNFIGRKQRDNIEIFCAASTARLTRNRVSSIVKGLCHAAGILRGHQILHYVADGGARDEKSRTFLSNSKRSHILRTSSRSRRLILSSIVSFAVWLKCTRTI